MMEKYFLDTKWQKHGNLLETYGLDFGQNRDIEFTTQHPVLASVRLMGFVDGSFELCFQSNNSDYAKKQLQDAIKALELPIERSYLFYHSSQGCIYFSPKFNVLFDENFLKLMSCLTRFDSEIVFLITREIISLNHESGFYSSLHFFLTVSLSLFSTQQKKENLISRQSYPLLIKDRPKTPVSIENDTESFTDFVMVGLDKKALVASPSAFFVPALPASPTNSVASSDSSYDYCFGE